MNTLRHIVTVILMTLVVPSAVSAAQLYFEPHSDHTGPGFTVSLKLVLDQDVNAFSGAILFDVGRLRVASIREGSGVVSYWLDVPRVTEPGVIPFAGVVPGGLQRNLTDRVTLFDIQFEALEAGSTTLSIDDAVVFLHRPDATRDDVRSVPLSVILDSGDLGPPDITEDTIAPEPFAITIAHDPSITDNTNVAIFSVRDFDSGVAMIELRERFLGFFGRWHDVTSPAPLSWKWRFSILEVRATDYAGNRRVERRIPASVPLIAIVLAVGAVGAFVRRRI